MLPALSVYIGTLHTYIVASHDTDILQLDLCSLEQIGNHEIQSYTKCLVLKVTSKI